jgi:GINS complex subunit 1
MSFPDGVNLSADIKPPKSLYIEVKCLTDHGKLELENGEVIHLQKNSIHYLPRVECEQLIRQGILGHIIH